MPNISAKELVNRIRKRYRTETLNFLGKQVEVVIKWNPKYDCHYPVAIILNGDPEWKFIAADNYEPITDTDQLPEDIFEELTTFVATCNGMGVCPMKIVDTEHEAYLVCKSYVNPQSETVINLLLILTDYKIRTIICNENFQQTILFKMNENVKKMRVQLAQVLTYLKTELKQSREVSLTITAVQMCRMRLGKVLGALGEIYPYPESTNPANRTVEAATDINPEDTWLADWIKDEPADADQLIKVKMLRKMLKEYFFAILEADNERYINEYHLAVLPSKSVASLIRSSYECVVRIEDAILWLGCELEIVSSTSNQQ